MGTIKVKRFQWRKDKRDISDEQMEEILQRAEADTSNDAALSVIHNLRVEIDNYKMALELKDHALRDTINNDSARGYTIQAMKDTDFKTEDIKKVLTAMYYNFDEITTEDAENIYNNWRG